MPFVKAVDTANAFQFYDTAKRKAEKVLADVGLELSYIVAATPRGRFVPVVLLAQPNPELEERLRSKGLFPALASLAPLSTAAA